MTRYRRPCEGPTSKEPGGVRVDLCTVNLILLVLLEVIRFFAGMWMT
jgi:hypothetical protein